MAFSGAERMAKYRRLSREKGLCAICCRFYPERGNVTCEGCIANINALRARRKAQVKA